MPIYFWPLLKVCDWSGHLFGASASPRSLTKKMAMSPSSTVHGGQQDTKTCGIRVAIACGIRGWRNLGAYAWTSSYQRTETKQYKLKKTVGGNAGWSKIGMATIINLEIERRYKNRTRRPHARTHARTHPRPTNQQDGTEGAKTKQRKLKIAANHFRGLTLSLNFETRFEPGCSFPASILSFLGSQVWFWASILRFDSEPLVPVSILSLDVQ